MGSSLNNINMKFAGWISDQWGVTRSGDSASQSGDMSAENTRFEGPVAEYLHGWALILDNNNLLWWFTGVVTLLNHMSAALSGPIETFQYKAITLLELVML